MSYWVAHYHDLTGNTSNSGPEDKGFNFPDFLTIKKVKLSLYLTN
jgi:hypothetical protein